MLEGNYIPEPMSGCWLWEGAVQANGYGVAGRKLAHRQSWEDHHGPIPEGMSVLHKCDVRSCINPDHMFLGTQQDNLADMRRKGRGVVPQSPAGEAHHFAVLTVAVVKKMRADHASGRSIKSIADEHATHPATARDAIRHATWKHVQ